MNTTPARPRAVFLDVDGTLLQDGHHVPASASAAVRAARAAGHLVFLSTGRGLSELPPVVSGIGFDGAVSGGGAYANVGDTLLASWLLTEADVAHLQQRFAAHGVHWWFQTSAGLFAGPGLAELMAAHVERDRIRHRERGETGPFFSVGQKEFADPQLFAASEAAKAVIMSDDPTAVAAALAELQSDYAVVAGTIPVPAGASGEVASAGVNKGVAILALLAHLGIDPSDAIAIGDNANDLEMFEVCGVSIAMGNASAEIQAAASEVTTAIDADGIHTAFARHHLL